MMPSANTVLKEQSETNTSLMGRLSIGNNDRRRKKEGTTCETETMRSFIPKVDEALKTPESKLKRLSPKQFMRTYHTLKKSENWFFKAKAV